MKSISRNYHPAVQAACFFAICGITLFIFWPGLTGPFLFDDFPNLKPLAENGGITNLHNFLTFILTGHAGPLHRPIALASFVLNDFSWPSNPWTFKYTNLLIHLLNGVLVFTVCGQLGRLLGWAHNRRTWFALGVMAVWLLHPLQISNIMLVIQRMNELSALFTLAAIVVYLRGRRIAQFAPHRGYVWMTAAILLGLPLAVLSKENGILLCGFLLVIETTLLTGVSRPKHWRRWALVFLVAPLALLVLRFAIHWRGVLGGYKGRDFSLYERLLTEPRILFDYLHHIILPSIGSSGLFHDHFQFSTSLFSPPTTAVALAGLAGLLGSALWLRRVYPAWSFAVLWFLVGHSLESSFIGLELYFEHRNYLPLLGPVLAAVYGITQLPRRPRQFAVVGVVLFAAACAFLSNQSSHVWSSQKSLATVWAAENPASARAQQFAADYWVKEGRDDIGLTHLRQAAQANPDDLGVGVEIVLLECRLGRYKPASFEQAMQLAPTGLVSNAVVTTIEQLSNRIQSQPCGNLTQADFQRFLSRLATNPKYQAKRGYYRDIWYLKGQIAFTQRRLQAAVENLDKANELEPSLDILLLQIGLLMSAGRPDLAQEFYRKAKALSDSLPWYRPKRSADLQSIHESIEQAIKNQQAKRGGAETDPNRTSMGSDSIEIFSTPDLAARRSSESDPIEISLLHPDQMGLE